jgi:hypothetical protein
LRRASGEEVRDDSGPISLLSLILAPIAALHDYYAWTLLYFKARKRQYPTSRLCRISQTPWNSKENQTATGAESAACGV